jgi:hypothetical protein
MRRSVLVFMLALLVVGCSGSASSPQAPPSEQPAAANPAPANAAPANPGPAGPAAGAAAPALAAFPVPPSPRGDLVVNGLQVSPDGKGFAAWYVLQGDGLAAWREGDAQALPLAGVVARQFAWSDDGFYFVNLTSPMEGRRQLMRYRWGQPAAELLFDTRVPEEPLHGLTWDPVHKQLLFISKDGWQASSPDGKQLTSLNGSVAIQPTVGSSVHPQSRRYLYLYEGWLYLGRIGEVHGKPLADVALRNFIRAAWSADGSLVAAAFAEPGKQEMLLFHIPPDGDPKALLRTEGAEPTFLQNDLWYLDGAGSLMRLPAGAKEPQPVKGAESIRQLTADPAAGRIYLIGAPPAGIRFLDVK